MSGKYKWDKKYLYWGITAFLVIAGSVTFYLLLSKWPGIKAVLLSVLGAMAPIIYGFVFAYLFNKVLTYFEIAFMKKLGARLYPRNEQRAKRTTRILAIVLTLLCFFVVIGGMMWLILPQIYQSLRSLVINMPNYYNTIVEWINQFLEDNPSLETIAVNAVGNLSESFTTWLKTSVLPQAELIVTNITSGVIGIVREMLYILVGIVVSVYVLYHKETFGAQTKKLVYSAFKPGTANKLIDDVRFIDRTCGGFISGKLIDSLIIGLVCYIVLSIVNMPYNALVSVIVCVTNVIPFFGPFIGAVPSALLILLESPAKCLVFVIFIIILQQIDGNILGPKILGNTIGLSGFWIMFAILFFGNLFGFWGMLLGVPVFAVIYAATKNFNSRRLEGRSLPTDTESFENLSHIDPETNQPVYKQPVTRVRQERRRWRGKKTGGNEGENGSDKKD